MEGGCRIIMNCFLPVSGYILYCVMAAQCLSQVIQLGQENKVITMLQLSASSATMEEEIVGVSVRLNQAIRQQFQNIVIHIFEFPEARVDTSRLDYHLLA